MTVTHQVLDARSHALCRSAQAIALSVGHVWLAPLGLQLVQVPTEAEDFANVLLAELHDLAVVGVASLKGTNARIQCNQLVFWSLVLAPNVQWLRNAQVVVATGGSLQTAVIVQLVWYWLRGFQWGFTKEAGERDAAFAPLPGADDNRIGRGLARLEVDSELLPLRCNASLVGEQHIIHGTVANLVGCLSHPLVGFLEQTVVHTFLSNCAFGSRRAVADGLNSLVVGPARSVEPTSQRLLLVCARQKLDLHRLGGGRLLRLLCGVVVFWHRVGRCFWR